MDAPESIVRHRFFSIESWEKLGDWLNNGLVILLLVLYLFPIVFMASTAFMGADQLRDRNAPVYPAVHVTYDYQGQAAPVYYVPGPTGERQLALVTAGRTSSEFVDPQNATGGLIHWDGSWRTLKGVYKFQITLDNFKILAANVRLPQMLWNTVLAATVSGFAVIVSSIVVAYGFSRFKLPGGDLLYYVLIATLLIPDKVTLIPTYFFFVRVLHWNSSWLPILVPFLFGNAVYIFLLRQNFKSVPREMEEAAMLDGAGPLRTLFQVVLPQSWPVVITISLLHFFYIWNETRQVSLYLSTQLDQAPISFGVQQFQSLVSAGNVLQAGAIVVMIVPIVVLFVSQRFFMRSLVITGVEKI
ncbi:MAG TPA: carbohydrate ABC transporter permease [Terriglobales bacterium]|nr:carbohydrate ABC transporter permease [Terriglobales bacterium]